jgi:chromosome segregation ATPase
MEIVLVAGAVSAFATALITAIIARILCSKRLTALSELYGQEQTVRDALEKCQSELSEVTDRLSEAKTAAQKQLAGYAQAVDRKKAQTDSQLKAFETIQADTVAKRQALEDELSALQGKLSTDREALRALEERTRGP